jgi:hypothetical protein
MTERYVASLSAALPKIEAPALSPSDLGQAFYDHLYFR